LNAENNTAEKKKTKQKRGEVSL